jgi:hypothetical protein
MYNPPGQEEYEFIELKNMGQHPFNLAGLFFEGIDFTFPAQPTFLEPGEVIVLVSNPEAFAEKYPDVPIFDRYNGQLSNKGDTLALKDHHGKTILSITYDDENGWPLSPDGRGDSLVLADFGGDPSHPKSWRASADRYGSPGTDELVDLISKLNK